MDCSAKVTKLAGLETATPLAVRTSRWNVSTSISCKKYIIRPSFGDGHNCTRRKKDSHFFVVFKLLYGYCDVFEDGLVRVIEEGCLVGEKGS